MEHGYLTTDNILIDIQHIKRNKTKGTILLWPCGLGDIHSRLYSKPIDAFPNYDLILYNPRGHGKSQGNFDFEKSLSDIISFLKNQIFAMPLYGVGHSTGGTGVLKIADHFLFHKLFVFSPILSSRKSIQYMYKMEQQHLFARLFCESRQNIPELWDILMNNKWIDPKEWLKIKCSLDSYSLPKISSVQKSMEGIAHPGYDAYDSLQKQHKKTFMFIPQQDNWLSIENLQYIAQKYSIPIASIAKARNHFFNRRWKNIWQLIQHNLKSKK